MRRALKEIEGERGYATSVLCPDQIGESDPGMRQ